MRRGRTRLNFGAGHLRAPGIGYRVSRRRGENWLGHQVSTGEREPIFFNQPLVVAPDEPHSLVEPRTTRLQAVQDLKEVPTMGRMFANRPLAEADWKRLRALHAAALDRFCKRTLDECAALLEPGQSSAHQQYLDLFRLLQDRDRELAEAFDDMRRSRAVERLAAMVSLGVVTEEEMQQFTPELREAADLLSRMRRGP